MGYNYTYEDMSKYLETLEEHDQIVNTCIDIFANALQNQYDEE